MPGSKQYQKIYYKKNKARLDKYSNEWRARLRLELIKKFGGRCVECGESDVVVLTFDHISNDGNKDRKERPINVIHIVEKEPHRFQLLCQNCNWRKEYWRRKNAVHK